MRSAISGKPVRVEPLRGFANAASSDAIREAIEKLRLKQQANLPILQHAAMVFGWDMVVPCRTETSDLLVPFRKFLFDDRLSGSYFSGEPIFVETRWGLRNRTQLYRDRQWQAERQAHAGQLLAAMAQEGISLDQDLLVDERVHKVRDLLNDAIANYRHEELEIDWLCIALALYLPPQRTWTDKFGRVYSFDEMAQELLRRVSSTSQTTCYGVHSFEALALLLRVDIQWHVLSDAPRARIRSQLADAVRRLMQTQLADGSWSRTWRQLGRPEESIASEPVRHERVHVTGHHVDWLLYLPVDMLPPDAVIQRAGVWLLESLQNCDDASILDYYCPYAHAARALLLMTSKNSTQFRTAS